MTISPGVFVHRDSGPIPDAERLTTFVRELTDTFPDPDSGIGRAGLLNQAWFADPTLLTTKQPQASDGGHTGKPGSRPPCRLDLWSHVQACYWQARKRASELDVDIEDGWDALLRLPALIERYDEKDERRKLTVKRIGQQHSTLRTALGWQEPRADWHGAICPKCNQVGTLSCRIQQQRVWCRNDDCDFWRKGGMAILALAS